MVISKINYLNSVGKRRAHAVAGRHGFGEGLGALELRINDLKTADACFHYHICRESLQTLHFIIKVTVGGEVSISTHTTGKTLVFFHALTIQCPSMLL